MAEHGNANVEASSIPYMRKFGGEGAMHMTLKDYVEEVVEHRMVGGHHPWYVFRGHPIPRDSESNSSFVKVDAVPMILIMN